MFRSIVLLALAALLLPAAQAQTSPTRRTGKKQVPYSTRKAARKAPGRLGANINPHTGRPYGAGVPQDIKDGSSYLAPAMPMRKQVGYQNNGAYNDNRPRRAAAPKPANSSLSREVRK